jgi:hypothetical protein
MAQGGDMERPFGFDDGFRVRGAQPTRLDAFVDAAFAFAVTLLVVSIGRVPATVAELVHAMRGVPAFAAAFFLIARFWQSHRLWSRRFGLDDRASVRLSLALVFVILVYVYPLRMVATMMFGMLSGGVLAEEAIGVASVGDLRVLYATFAVGYGLAAALLALLYVHAARLHGVLGLSASERVRTAAAVAHHAALGAIALVSLLLALLLPLGRQASWYYWMPGAAYFLIWPLRSALARRERGQLARLAAEGTA